MTEKSHRPPHLATQVLDLQTQLATQATTMVQLATRVQELEAVVAKLGAPVVEASRRLSSGFVSSLVALSPYTELEVLTDWSGGGIQLARGQVVRADKYPVAALVQAGLQVGEVKPCP